MFFDSVKNNIQSQQKEQVQRQSMEAQQNEKSRVSKAKKQSLVNSLIMQRIPQGGGQ